MPFWVCKICGSKNPSTNEDTKPQTNADRIRAMSDEELAVFLRDVESDYVQYPFVQDWDEWLKQPADMRGEEE